MSVCLDAFSLLTWLQDEPGAGFVEAYLSRAANEPDFRCFISAINLGEVHYHFYRTRGAHEADTFWRDAQRGIVPLSIVEPTQSQTQQAARLKARYPIAYADAFVAQLAQEKRLPLVSGDPELRILETAGLLTIMWLSQ